MAAQTLLNGSVIIRGEGYDPVTVDFGRDSALTVAKSGSAKWTPANIAAGNASPTGDLEEWQRLILKKSGGKVTDYVFTTSAWKGFICDPVLKGAIYYPQLASAGNVINPGAQIERGAVYKGRWGDYDLWLYNDWYVEQGTEGNATVDKEYPMLPDGAVVAAGPNLMGTRAFGQIMDPEFNYAALPYAPKTWVNKDPAQRYILMQSAPITIPSRVNASLGATVCDPVYD